MTVKSAGILCAGLLAVAACVPTTSRTLDVRQDPQFGGREVPPPVACHEIELAWVNQVRGCEDYGGALDGDRFEKYQKAPLRDQFAREPVPCLYIIEDFRDKYANFCNPPVPVPPGGGTPPGNPPGGNPPTDPPTDPPGSNPTPTSGETSITTPRTSTSASFDEDGRRTNATAGLPSEPGYTTTQSEQTYGEDGDTLDTSADTGNSSTSITRDPNGYQATATAGSLTVTLPSAP